MEFSLATDYWSYQWCHKKSVSQYHFNLQTNKVDALNNIGSHVPQNDIINPDIVENWFLSEESSCVPDNKKEAKQRSAKVNIFCCKSDFGERDLFFASVKEQIPCHYEINICANVLCYWMSPAEIEIVGLLESKKKVEPKKLNLKKSQASSINSANEASNLSNRRHNSKAATDEASVQSGIEKPLSGQEQKDLRERVRAMFIHGYDNYMSHAFPAVSEILFQK